MHRLVRGGRWGALVALLVFSVHCTSGAPATETGTLHPCSGAGQWFPADADQLRAEITKDLDAAQDPPVPGRLRALVVPHAGYQYSGPTAAYAYKLLRGQAFHRVIILALSHSMAIPGASVLDVDGYQTPLGTVKTDREAIGVLLKSEGFTTVAAAHKTEHSDENQIPFLQCALGDFRLVSILVGQPAPGKEEEEFKTLTAAIRPLLDDQTLLVVSSDFTHFGTMHSYLPFRHNAAANLHDLDGEAIGDLLDQSFADFTDFFTRTDASICGRAPLSLLLKLLGPEDHGVFLHYDRSGNPDQVDQPSVGYCALAFARGADDATTATQEAARPDWTLTDHNRGELNAEECATLLRLARASIAARLNPKSEGSLHAADFELTPRLMKAQAAFVSLTIGGELRGCVGLVASEDPLYQTVSGMALQAAFGDQRFGPLTAEELNKTQIEVSALITPDKKVAANPMVKLEHLDDIRIGVDGLYIVKGLRTGVFLPKVPVDFGWDRDAYLRNLCRKADLPSDAWKDAELYRFGAQVFSEPEPEKGN